MPPQQPSPSAATTPAGQAAPAWDATLSQSQFMEKDTVLTLATDDAVVGSATKKDAHVFSPARPRGVLHRAFSVFLFDRSTGELLLQKRAATKVTHARRRAGGPAVLTIARSHAVTSCAGHLPERVDEHVLQPPPARDGAGRGRRAGGRGGRQRDGGEAGGGPEAGPRAGDQGGDAAGEFAAEVDGLWPRGRVDDSCGAGDKGGWQPGLVGQEAGVRLPLK